MMVRLTNEEDKRGVCVGEGTGCVWWGSRGMNISKGNWEKRDGIFTTNEFGYGRIK